jgi:predicted PurR-regulated permease PerM
MLAQAVASLSHDMVAKPGLGRPNAAVLPAAHCGEPGVVKPQSEVCVIKFRRWRHLLSDFFESPAARPQPEPAQTSALEMLATLFLVALVVTTLYVGREIFVPIAIAILLSFVLSPPILLLRSWGLGRVFSVLTVVFAALVIAFSVSAILTRQVSELAVDLPLYQATINAKLDDMRDAAADNAVFAKFSAELRSLAAIHPNRPMPLNAGAHLGQQKSQPIEDQKAQRPIPVEVYQPAAGPLALVQTIAGTALSPLETIGIVLIYVVFILLQREDLRNRFIRLVGSGDLQRTTSAMNDAAGRLSRFLLAQTLVNASFGIIVAVGLYMIGIPSPILWGIAAFLLRFIPYLGSFIAASFPIALAAAIDPGWGIALETLALFLIVETVIGQAVEPWLYGHNTGISPIAVVISATFWTWLWGLVGLVLSTPLTVCLVVLGRHVERLAFLDVIFGDAPPLTPVETFYQRLLVGDASEVADQAEQFLKTNSLVNYYDEVALQALLMAQADLRRGVLDELRQRRIKETIEEVIEDLSDHVDRPPEPSPETAEPIASLMAADSPNPGLGLAPSVETAQLHAQAPGFESQTSVLCVAGRSFLDEAAAALFAQILGKHGLAAKVEPAGALTIGRISRLSAEGARIVCLSYLDADVSGASARFAVRRLRRRLPETKILAGFWQTDPGQASGLGAETKADFCATRFRDALDFCLDEAKDLDARGEVVSGPGGMNVSLAHTASPSRLPKTA